MSKQVDYKPKDAFKAVQWDGTPGALTDLQSIAAALSLGEFLQGSNFLVYARSTKDNQQLQFVPTGSWGIFNVTRNTVEFMNDAAFKARFETV